jgi:hypothetical protein
MRDRNGASPLYTILVHNFWRVAIQENKGCTEMSTKDVLDAQGEISRCAKPASGPVVGRSLQRPAPYWALLLSCTFPPTGKIRAVRSDLKRSKQRNFTDLNPSCGMRRLCVCVSR